MTYAARIRDGTGGRHFFATLKVRMGATHFLTKRLPKVATEMALHVLAYNLTRIMNIMGIQPVIAAMRVPPWETQAIPLGLFQAEKGDQ